MGRHFAAQADSDAILPDDISPRGLQPADHLSPSAVFVTGATGYLGAFLVAELVRRTRAKIYCLVRSDGGMASEDRVREAMRRYRVWDDSYAQRIQAVAGDLTQPRLGLQEAWTDLAQTVDVVYHSGALVNFVYPYSSLRGPNIGGTRELLRFACTGRLKAVHHVSTLDVLLGTGIRRPLIEDDAPLRARWPEGPGGYTLTKWVAERVANIARERGIPLAIYRPGLIFGDSSTGAVQTNDYLLVALRGFVAMGIVPEYPRIFDAVPVDHVARAIVHTSLRADTTGRFFHILNPSPVTIARVCEWVRSFGYEFEIVPFEEGRRRAAEVEPSHPLYPLLPLIRDADPDPESPAVDPALAHQVQPEVECRNLLRALEGSGIACPPFDERFLHRVLSYLIEVGFLPPPVRLGKGSDR